MRRNLSGTLINERASFNNFNGTDSYIAYPCAAVPAGNVQGVVPIKTLNDNRFFSGGLDYALTRDQVLRLNFNGSQFDSANQGSAPTISRRARSRASRARSACSFSRMGRSAAVSC